MTNYTKKLGLCARKSSIECSTTSALESRYTTITKLNNDCTCCQGTLINKTFDTKYLPTEVESCTCTACRASSIISFGWTGKKQQDNYWSMILISSCRKQLTNKPTWINLFWFWMGGGLSEWVAWLNVILGWGNLSREWSYM